MGPIIYIINRKKNMKLIASDFDGTVRTDEKGLARDIAAIKMWKAAGNKFAIISGRNAPQIRDIAKKYEIPADFVLGDSGNTCYVNGRLEYYHSSTADLLRELYNMLLEYKAYYIIVNCPEVATIVYREKDGGIVCDLFGELDDFTEFTQVSCIFDTFEETARAASAINAHFGEKLCALQNFDCLDIVPDGRNKAASLKYLSERLGIDEENVYCIGDNYNDILMLDRFSSFVVENAPDDVKSHASVRIVPSVADMIEYLLKNV